MGVGDGKDGGGKDRDVLLYSPIGDYCLLFAACLYLLYSAKRLPYARAAVTPGFIDLVELFTLADTSFTISIKQSRTLVSANGSKYSVIDGF